METLYLNLDYTHPEADRSFQGSAYPIPVQVGATELIVINNGSIVFFTVESKPNLE